MANYFGAAQPMPLNPWTGQPDYTANLFPTTNGLTAATTGSDVSSLGSWFGDLGEKIGNSGFTGKTLADGTKTQGWGAPVLGALGGLASSYLGFQQLGQAKDAFNENKRQFEMNWGAQQKTVNSQLEDRQRARIASNPGAYTSVSEYMKKNGI